MDRACLTYKKGNKDQQIGIMEKTSPFFVPQLRWSWSRVSEPDAVYMPQFLWQQS